MSDLNFAAQMKKKLDRFQGDIYRNGNLTYLGHPDGTISVADHPGHVWVCTNDSQPVQVYNKHAPLIYGLPVIVGITPEEPWLLQIISFATTSSQSTGTVNYSVGPHADTHSFFGTDPVFIEKRQFLPSRVGPGTVYSGSAVSGVAAVEIYQDVVYVGGVWESIPYQTIDLNAYVPATGESMYVLITIAPGGTIALSLGDIVSGSTPDISVTGVLHAIPAGHLALAFVRLWGGMTEVVENNTYTDILDARSMFVVGSSTPDLTQTFVTVAAESSLPNHRVLTAGAGITITDGGAGAGIIIAASGSSVGGGDVYLDASNVFTQINPLVTPAESWIGPSATDGVYFKGGRVGFGTIDPLSKFHVRWSDTGGSAQIYSDAFVFENNGNMILQLMGAVASGKSIVFGNPNNGADGQFGYNSNIVPSGFIFNVNGNNFAVAIDANGRIGIGIATPAYPLDVIGNANITGQYLVNGIPVVPQPPSAPGLSLISSGIPLQWTETVPVSGSGVPGRVAQWSTATELQAANLIGPASNVLTLEANAAVTMTVPATGTAAILDVDNAFNGFITGGNASTGRFGSWGGSAVSGSTVVIASGATAVNSVITINYAVRENTSTDTGGGTVVLVPGGGAVNLYNDGTYSCAVTCAANGSVTVAATGARTFFVSLWMVWI
jgi:hypothetical protein